MERTYRRDPIRVRRKRTLTRPSLIARIASPLGDDGNWAASQSLNDSK